MTATFSVIQSYAWPRGEVNGYFVVRETEYGGYRLVSRRFETEQEAALVAAEWEKTEAWNRVALGRSLGLALGMKWFSTGAQKPTHSLVQVWTPEKQFAEFESELLPVKHRGKV